MTSDNPTSQKELCLVLLGKRGAGKSTTGNTILGREAFLPQQPGSHDSQGSEKQCATVAGRQVTVVETPDWLGSELPLEERMRHISSCLALSAPGPQAFLLCVPLETPPHRALQHLAVLETLLGPGAVRDHTLVLFTHTEQLGLGLEEQMSSLTPELLELVESCGGRYHGLETGGGGEEGEEKRRRRRRRRVEELMEKVEEMLRESGEERYSCALYLQVEERVRGRQRELVRETRGGETPLDEEPDEEEMEIVREEAERSVGDLDIDLESLPSPSPSPSPSSPSPWSVQGWWEWLLGWLRAVPGLVGAEALLGSVVGLVVGGPVGGMLGATVRSLATEVGRRKTPNTAASKKHR
ncbi:GTPase IMAP family member 7 [Osmerus eperlanus]|uniref:GTPase IMAP family member 7 n=1 Tax=Osmerus eperlanus TaxID=29151 RepID=UPI002E1602D4